MAEGFAKHMLCGENSFIESAGVKNDGVNKLAIQVMSEVGVDISTQNSINMQGIDFDQFDVIVTVCDHAKKMCPVVSNRYMLHYNLKDPAQNRGNLKQRLIFYRDIRDRVYDIVRNLLMNYSQYVKK